MDVQLFTTLAELGGTGVGVFALWLFYKMINDHRKERERDGDKWRDTFKDTHKETTAVVKDLTEAIKDINRQ